MTDGTKEGVGTEITLFLNEDCLEFANEYRAREIIEKYCSFMPTEIYLSKANAPEEYETIDKEDKLDTDKVIEEIHEEAKTEEKENENGEKEAVELLTDEEADKLIDTEDIQSEAIKLAENDGIIFLDEIDKITSSSDGGQQQVSREGVQRDILPIVEGSTVRTKYGNVKTGL